MFDYRDYHRTVVAFHGTTVAAANRLVEGGEFTPSSKIFEWLGKRVWRGSWIYEEAHIQICVRKPQNILGLWHVRPDGRYGKGEEVLEKADDQEGGDEEG